jgi:hypothetical protein
MRVEFDLPITRWCSVVDVMHRLSPPAWKIVSRLARDDLIRQFKEHDPRELLRRDLFNATGIDMSN